MHGTKLSTGTTLTYLYLIM